MLGRMKTAISIPDPLFYLAEQLANRLGYSRSRLYAEALREFARRHDEDEVTRRLNEIYDQTPAEIDPVIAQMAAATLPKDSWR